MDGALLLAGVHPDALDKMDVRLALSMFRALARSNKAVQAFLTEARPDLGEPEQYGTWGDFYGDLAAKESQS